MSLTKADYDLVVMLDTNIFDQILTNQDMWNSLPKNLKYVATQIQLEQLKNIPDNKYRTQLINLFNTIIEEIPPTIDKEWCSFNHSNFSNSRFISPQENSDLTYLGNGNSKHAPDILILLTAQHGYKGKVVIVSNEKKNPFKKAKSIGYQILSFDEFISKFTQTTSPVQ